MNSPNLCGNENYGDNSMNKQIDKILNHNENTVTITFGSTLNKSPCEASYGIDNVMIFIKWKNFFKHFITVLSLILH